MKKMILILFVLIITTKCVIAVEIFNNVNAENIIEGMVKDDKEIIENQKVEDTNKDSIEEEETKQENIAEDDINKDTLSEKVSEINAMQDDEQKIKEWAKFCSTDNYIIVNKKNCSATIYDKDSSEIISFEVGVGEEIGDDFNDTSGLLGKSKNTTPAGEYTLIPNVFNKSAYGDITLSLGTKANKAKNSKKMVALHKVPKFRQKDRLKKFYDGNLANNRMSHGCINFIEKDFKELTKYVRAGFKVYILPEEADNKLILKKSDKNKFELMQTKY